MSGITISDVTNAFKRVYDPKIIEMRNQSIGVDKRFKEWPSYTGTGQGFYFATRMRGNRVALGARAEAGALPTAGYITYVQGYVEEKYNYRTLEVTGPAVGRSLKEGGFVEVLADDIEDGTRDLLKDMNRQAWRAGDGVITTVRTTSTGTTMYVDSCRHIEPGDYLEVYTAAGVAEDEEAIVTNVDYVNRELTISGTDTFTEGSYVYRDGQYNSGVPLEPMGLDGMVDNSTAATFQNINPSTYAEWQSMVETNVGKITRQKLFKVNDFTRRLTGKQVDEIWSAPNARDQVFLLVQPSITLTAPKNIEIAYKPEDDPLEFQGENLCGR